MGAPPRRDGGIRPRAETGDAPPIFFLRHQKENAPCTVEKKKCQGPNPSLRSGLGKTGVGRVGSVQTCKSPAGCAWVFGNREMLPRSWGRGCGFRGGCRIWHASCPVRSASLRTTRVRIEESADSKSAERQRREEAGQIGLAPSDARRQSIAGGGPKISANPSPRPTLTPIQPPGSLAGTPVS